MFQLFFIHGRANITMMQCEWRSLRTTDAGSVVACKRCGRRVESRYSPARIHANCKGWPRTSELGHWLTLLLAAVGIHKSGYVWLKRRLGLGPKCGCTQRAARLNTWGHWFFRPRRG